MRVIVAEDNATNRLIVGKLLKSWGALVQFAVDGKEAVSLFEHDHDQIDLILMDCEMPEMDGYTATEVIRQSRFSEANLPIIALTAHALPEFRERAFAVGMTGYLTKPIDKAELLRSIRDACVNPAPASVAQ